MKLATAIEVLVGAVRLRPGLRHEDYVEILGWPAWRVTIAATRATVERRLVRSGASWSVRYWPTTDPCPSSVAPEAWVLLEQLRDAAGSGTEALTAPPGSPVEAAWRAWVDAGRPLGQHAPTRRRWRVLRPRGVTPDAPG